MAKQDNKAELNESNLKSVSGGRGVKYLRNTNEN